MIFSIFRNTLSVIIINILILINKILKKKIIFFYHPQEKLTLIHNYYIEDLFKEFDQNFYIIYGHRLKKNLGKKYFYLKQGYIKYLINVDCFISNNICDAFTKNSIKIYMHHDIYDTPLVSDEKQKELFQRVIKYNYLFLPNKKSIDMFKNFLTKNNANLNSILPELLETGYLKLDFLSKKKKSYKTTEKNSIVIAPTNFMAFPNLTIDNHLEPLIESLIDEAKSNIIYRPHPSNRDHPNTLKILKKFEGNKNFHFDDSIDYFKNYIKSYCMITDLSGTAYTYAFFTKQPVIFFSKNENLIRKLNYDDLSYFKDRNKIGVIAENINQIIKSISNIKNIILNTNNSINLLEKEMFYSGKSKNRIKNLINELLIENEKKSI